MPRHVLTNAHSVREQLLLEANVKQADAVQVVKAAQLVETLRNDTSHRIVHIRADANFNDAGRAYASDHVAERMMLKLLSWTSSMQHSMPHPTR